MNKLIAILTLLILLAPITLSKNFNLVLLKSDVSIGKACSYYRLYYNENLIFLLNDIKTLKVSKIKEVHGFLRKLWIDVKINESYNVSVPEYGTCEICGDYMVRLYEVDGKFVCEKCREDLLGGEE